MPAKYQTYPEYKDSGVEWFGRVPSHWRVAGFKKYLHSIVDYRGKTPNKTDDGVLLVTARNIKNGLLDYGLSQEFIATEDYDDVMSRGKPNIGDLLFTTEAPLGEVANVDKTDIALAQRVIKFCGKKNDLDNYYFKYLVMSQEFQQSLYLFASGSTVKGIKAERFVYLRKLLPALNEQQNIANFLDHETAKIDTLVEKQQQLIKLLKEKRQAVISHAVTKGLNPNAPMRDSGIEWLGEVPEHWEVIFIKHLSTVKRGASPRPIDDQKYFDENGEYAWVRIADVSKAGMYLTSTTQRLSDLGASLSVKLEPNQMFVSIAGTVGKPCLTISKVCIHDGFVYFPELKINNKFLYYIFEAGEAYLGLGKMGTQLNLNTETVGGIKIGLPSTCEIEQIIEAVELSNQKFDDLISKAELSIQLMHERRTALISAAVTGKFDVRKSFKSHGDLEHEVNSRSAL